MRAAIYARKSTEQNVSSDAKSVTRQIDNAKAFATLRGWTVDDAHIYVDDGVSGADTRRLRARQQMIDLATAKAFDVVVMQAQDRFSRVGGAKALLELEALAEHVEVHFYADGRQFESGTFESNTIGFLNGEFAAQFRRSIAAKTYEAMRRRAEHGHVTGGRVYGYDNIRVGDHVERRINVAEAKVVKRIFQACADGTGLKKIVFALNADRIAAPRTDAWEVGTIRAILRRSLYRGILEWDKTKKRHRDGSRRGKQQAKATWLTIDVPQLRIIDAELASAVDERLDKRRHSFLRDKNGRLLGRPRGTGVTRHLLSGFVQCECGAIFERVKGWSGEYFYQCRTRRRKGPSACTSDLTFDVHELENVFLDQVEHSVLDPDFIDQVVEALCAANPNTEREALLDERKRLVVEVTNLTAAIAAGGDIPALVSALASRDRRLKTLDKELARPVFAPERDELRAALQLRGAEWRGVLRSKHVEQARVVLQHLMDLPIRVINEPLPSYIKRGDQRGIWKARTRPNGMLTGIVPKGTSPTGFEPVFWP